jgi:hypothetical protein
MSKGANVKAKKKIVVKAWAVCRTDSDHVYSVYHYYEQYEGMKGGCYQAAQLRQEQIMTDFSEQTRIVRCTVTISHSTGESK